MKTALAIVETPPTIDGLTARIKEYDEEIVRTKERIYVLTNAISMAYARGSGTDPSVIADRRKKTELQESLSFQENAREIVKQQIADMRDAEGLALRRQHAKALDDALSLLCAAASSYQKWLSKYATLHADVVAAEQIVWACAAGFEGISAKPMEYSSNLPQLTALALYCQPGSRFPIPRQVSFDSVSQMRENGLCDVSTRAWELNALILKEIGYKQQTPAEGSRG